MRKIDLSIGNTTHHYDGPASYSEVPATMILRLRELVRLCREEAHKAIALPMLLYGISGRKMAVFFAKKTHHRHVAVDDLLEESGTDDPAETLAGLGTALIDSCAWVFTDPAPATWLLPHYWSQMRRFFAPAERLSNLTFHEFMLAHQYMESDPAKLCAILYRQGWLNSPHSKADARAPFDESLIANHADRYFRGEQHRVFREYVAWNYQGMLLHLQPIFPYVFRKPDPNQPVAQNQPNAWLDAALTLADEDPTRFHAFERENVWIVLKMLNARIKLNQELEAKNKKK